MWCYGPGPGKLINYRAQVPQRPIDYYRYIHTQTIYLQVCRLTVKIFYIWPKLNQIKI